MAFVYQAGVFTSYAINLGLADKQFQDQLIASQSGTAASYTQLSRVLVSDTISLPGNTNTNYDATLVLTQDLRSTEDNLPATLRLFYEPTLRSTDTYFQGVVGSTFRNYFDSKTTNTTVDYIVTSPASSATGFSSFRDLYRRVYNSELIYKLYDYNASAVLASTAGTFGFAGSLLELRKYFSTGTGGTITLSLTRTSDGGSDSVSLYFGPYSGTGASYSNIVTDAGSGTLYSSIDSVSVSGLSSGAGRTFEVWIR